MIMLNGLCGEDEQPYAWLAWGHHSDADMRRAIARVERDRDEPPRQWEIDRGWGRWRRRGPKGNPLAALNLEFFGDGWPIPFLNRPYTMATPIEEPRHEW